jgi:hypothetical protein
MKIILFKQNLYKTYWYLYFRNKKKPNLKKLKALIEETNNLKNKIQ